MVGGPGGVIGAPIGGNIVEGTVSGISWYNIKKYYHNQYFLKNNYKTNNTMDIIWGLQA